MLKNNVPINWCMCKKSDDYTQTSLSLSHTHAKRWDKDSKVEISVVCRRNEVQRVVLTKWSQKILMPSRWNAIAIKITKVMCLHFRVHSSSLFFSFYSWIEDDGSWSCILIIGYLFLSSVFFFLSLYYKRKNMCC